MKRSDYGLISDLDCWKHPGWSQFTEQMDGRLYGESALNTAWAWFKAGWSACGKASAH